MSDRTMAPGKIPSTKEDTTRDLFRFQFKKTRLCSFHMEGRCSKGAQCGFAHDISQVETPPDLTKTSLCAKWQQGQCNNTAATCKFAHGKRELRMTPQFVLGREGTKQEKSKKKKSAGKPVAQTNRSTSECHIGQVGTASAQSDWLHSKMFEQLSVDDGFGLWEEDIVASLPSLVAPPPGIPSTWKNEPMKVMAMESFTSEMEVAFRDTSSLFAEKLSEKYLHEWDNDRTTIGSNSDNRSSRSHSPSSCSLSPRKIFSSTMENHVWQEPWSFANIIC